MSLYYFTLFWRNINKIIKAEKTKKKQKFLENSFNLMIIVMYIHLMTNSQRWKKMHKGKNIAENLYNNNNQTLSH